MAKVIAIRGLSREQWLELRRTGIGGSDAAAVAGLSPYRSPYSVWAEKVGLLPSQEAGEPAYWGTVLEPIVAAEFARRSGLRVRRPRGMFRSARYPWQIANVDRLVYEPGAAGPVAVLECKTTGIRLMGEWEEGEIPDSYALQVQHYMDVLDLDHAYLAVLVDGHRFLWVRVDREEEVIRYLRDLELDMWRRVELREPPDLDGSEITRETLRRLHPRADPGSEVVLPLEAEEIIRDLLSADQDIQAAEERKRQAESRLLALLGDHEWGLLDGQRVVRWQTVQHRRTDIARFRNDHPDLAAQYDVLSEYRRFTVTREGRALFSHAHARTDT